MVTTFDGWETRLYGDAMALPAGYLSENELMHYRTKGSKNGVRRYQTKSGEWTPLGLKERRLREGWGDRAQRREEKRAARAARKEERRAARKEATNSLLERRRKNKVENMSDEELKARIARIKLEQEYKEMTKSVAVKAGEKVVAAIIEHNNKKDALRKQKADDERAEKQREFELKKAEQITKQKEFESNRSHSEAEKARQESEMAKTTQKVDLIKAKIGYKNVTARGGFGKMVNRILTGRGDAIASRYKGISDARNEASMARGKAKAGMLLAKGKRREADTQFEGELERNKKLRKYNRKNGRFDVTLKDPYSMSF